MVLSSQILSPGAKRTRKLKNVFIITSVASSTYVPYARNWGEVRRGEVTIYYLIQSPEQT